MARLLSRDEERDLGRKVRAGDAAALAELVSLNTGLVHDLVIKRNVRAIIGKRCTQVEEDLVGAGMMGLTRAACRFDPELGTKFSTFAWYWIRMEVQEELHFQLGGIGAGRKDRHEDEDGIMPDRATESDPAGPMIHAEDIALIRAAIAGLPANYATVLRHRWGIDGDELTQQQTATAIGRTKERVRQLEAASIAKLADRLHLGRPTVSITRMKRPELKGGLGR